MRFETISCSTKLSILTPPQIFSGDIPFKDVSCWSSLRRNVVKNAMRPAKPQPQGDIGREFDDKLWSLIEECWAQEPSNRPTAETVSLRLGGVNGCLVNPAEMYKEIGALTEELTRVKAARQELETELAELKKNLNEERDLRKRVEKNADERIKAARQDFETELARLRVSLTRRELEQAELKKDLDEERELRKQVEKNADERSKAAIQDLETELANLTNSLARGELEQAELKKGVDEERQLPKQLETDADKLPISSLLTDEPGVSPSEPTAIVQRPIVQVESPSISNGNYIIKNRTGNIYWTTMNFESKESDCQEIYFWHTKYTPADVQDERDLQVNEYSLIIQVLRG